MIAAPRRVAALLLVVAFSVGALSGMALEEGLGLDWFDFLDEDEDAPGRVLDGLQLTGDQRARADAILERQEERLDAYWTERLPEIQAILDGSYAELREILDPRQRAEFDERVRRLHRGASVETGD